MAKPKRWSAKIPEEKVNPVGSNHALNEAKKELGPFDPNHSADSVCRCEKCAEAKIVKLAKRFNRLKFIARSAPRAIHVTRNLQELAFRSQQLATFLSSLDDYSRQWLLKARKPMVGRPDTRLLHRRAGARELPPPTAVANEDGKLVFRLQALSEYADLMAREFEIWSAINTPFPLYDKGGNTNIVTQWNGTPSEILVLGAYHIYDYFRPGEARKTEDGSFHTFVNQVYVFATGSRKGQSSLLLQIKKRLGRNGALKFPK
jgi:hypothetical protein